VAENSKKNFSYRRGTARRVLAVEIMSTAGQLYGCTKNAGDEGIVPIGDPGQSRWKVPVIFNLSVLYGAITIFTHKHASKTFGGWAPLNHRDRVGPCIAASKHSGNV